MRGARHTGQVIALLVVLAVGSAASVEAQSLAEWDRQALMSVYAVDAPSFTGVMRGANASFYPVVIGGPLVAWSIDGAQELTGDADFGTAYRLTVSEAGAVALVFGIKRLVRRPRPYAALPNITSRSPRHQPGATLDPYAFPSGHAALSFAVATSLTLSHPRWFVAVPTYAWAASVATSRVWLGVHYPSDVLVGALLGAAVSYAVHQARSSLTPDRLEGEDDRAMSIGLFVVRLPLGG